MSTIEQILSQRLNKPELLRDSFPEQRAFIQDPSKLKALFCTRRAAKSFTGGLYLVQECLDNPGVNCLFIALTRQSAQGIIWKDILKEINRKHDLNMRFNESKLTATFPNGSMIQVTGVDADESEMEKLLGKKYRLVVLDEGSLYSVDVRRLVYGILKPAVADNRGTICIAGTACDITQGLFYDITKGLEPGWKLFQWTALDNPYISTQWQEELEEIRLTRPLFMETPLFKQWYLNQWVVDTDKLVYKFHEDRNYYESIPRLREAGWSIVLGVDLGYSPDPSAFVLAQFHENDKTLYISETYKRTEMDITDVANKIKEYQARFPAIFKVIIDGSNKQAVEEIQKRHGVALTAAEKTGKSDFIEVMNAELIQGNIKVARTATDIVSEWKSLVWETEGDKIKHPRKEHPGLANHLTDAALYAWRYCYQFLSAPAKKAPTSARDNWPEYSRQMAEDALERQIKQQEQQELAADQQAMMDMDMDESPLKHYLNKRRDR